MVPKNGLYLGKRTLRRTSRGQPGSDCPAAKRAWVSERGRKGREPMSPPALTTSSLRAGAARASGGSGAGRAARTRTGHARSLGDAPARDGSGLRRTRARQDPEWREARAGQLRGDRPPPAAPALRWDRRVGPEREDTCRWRIGWRGTRGMSAPRKDG